MLVQILTALEIQRGSHVIVCSMTAELSVFEVTDNLSHLTMIEPNYHGLNRDSNPGPLAPKARIIPLDH